MKEAIRRARPEDEHAIPEGCWILELSNSEADPELSVARARVPPGVTTRWHRLRDVFLALCTPRFRQQAYEAL